MSITAWTVIAVISVVALVIIIKLAILAFMMKREKKQLDGTCDEEDAKTRPANEH